MKVLKQLLDELKHPSETMFVGVGNILKGDDGVGSFVLKKLIDTYGEELPNGAKLLDAGIGLENALGKIINSRPRAVVFVDAVGPQQTVPYDIVVLSQQEVLDNTFSTHNISLATVIKYLSLRLQEEFGVNPEFFIVGIKSLKIGFAECMSEEVLERAEEVSQEIARWAEERTKRCTNSE